MQSKPFIGDHFERFIAQLVASGRYSDEGEVIREALRGLEDRERPKEPDLDEIETFPTESFADIEAGLVYPLKQSAHEVFADTLRSAGRGRVR